MPWKELDYKHDYPGEGTSFFLFLLFLDTNSFIKSSTITLFGDLCTSMSSHFSFKDNPDYHRQSHNIGEISATVSNQ